MGQTLLLSEQDVRALLPMEDVVAAVEKTFRGMGDGTVVNPSKVNLDLGEIAPYPPYNGFMNAMPAYVGFSDVAGLKWAGGNLGERKKRGIPYCSFCWSIRTSTTSSPCSTARSSRTCARARRRPWR